MLNKVNSSLWGWSTQHLEACVSCGLQGTWVPKDLGSSNSRTVQLVVLPSYGVLLFTDVTEEKASIWPFDMCRLICWLKDVFLLFFFKKNRMLISAFLVKSAIKVRKYFLLLPTHFFYGMWLLLSGRYGGTKLLLMWLKKLGCQFCLSWCLYCCVFIDVTVLI